MKFGKILLKMLMVGIGLLLALAGWSWLVNRNLPTASAVVDRLSEREKGRIAEFYHVRQQIGEKVWPGWESADIPYIVYNEAYAFLIGYPMPADGWVKVPQNDLRGGSWELVPDDLLAGEPYYRQPLSPDGETPEAFAVLVGERWVASMPTY